ncbi:hypothetical protein CRG98_026331 [Punica granatum]|uniref:O-fucosyltransferase family protein n=1 Tax=Punica granatum TaxID=22663 RepID=A0A2I0JBA6_PUNGR|nr:hypothetical protein CRG98_026331 [Punica granatum]
MVPLPAHVITGDNISEEKVEFWRQPNGEGSPALFRFQSQTNQIVDAVVIARILGEALVVPVLLLNLIWQDESQFSELFDIEHFKKMLQADIHTVSVIPPTHSMPRHSVEMPHDVSPLWIRTSLLEKVGDFQKQPESYLN